MVITFFTDSINVSPVAGIVVILEVVKLAEERRVVVQGLSARNDIFVHVLISLAFPEVVSVGQ